MSTLFVEEVQCFAFLQQKKIKFFSVMLSKVDEFQIEQIQAAGLDSWKPT